MERRREVRRGTQGGELLSSLTVFVTAAERREALEVMRRFDRERGRGFMGMARAAATVRAARKGGRA